MPEHIYEMGNPYPIKLASTARGARDVAEKFEELARKTAELDRILKRTEGRVAWNEGHALLCKEANCGHVNPYAD